MLPEREPVGIQWAAFGVEESGQAPQSRFRHRMLHEIAATRRVGFIGEQGIHAVRAHEDVPLVRMEGVALVPVDAVQTQGQCDRHYCRQHEERPGNPAVQGEPKTKIIRWGHRGHLEDLCYLRISTLIRALVRIRSPFRSSSPLGQRCGRNTPTRCHTSPLFSPSCRPSQWWTGRRRCSCAGCPGSRS